MIISTNINLSIILRSGFSDGQHFLRNPYTTNVNIICIEYITMQGIEICYEVIEVIERILAINPIVFGIFFNNTTPKKKN